MGGIPKLPARNVAAAFVLNAGNSFPFRKWFLDIPNKHFFVKQEKQARCWVPVGVLIVLWAGIAVEITQNCIVYLNEYAGAWCLIEGALQELIVN